MKYFEVTRFSDQDMNQDDFREIKKLLARGWTRKALQYMLNWYYGGENLDVARVYGKIWDSPTDPNEPSDSIVRQETYEDTTFFLCEASDRSGFYHAYYLSASVSEQDLE